MPTSEDKQSRRVLPLLVADGVLAFAMGNIITGPVFVTYALMLGASNSVVGLLTGLLPLAQILEWSAANWLRRTGNLRGITLASVGLGRSAWLLVALLPWALPAEFRIAGLFLITAFFFCSNAVATCAFNAWVRDLVADHRLGRIFGLRMAAAAAAGAVAALVAAAVLSAYPESSPDALSALSSVFVGAALVGLLGVLAIAALPVPPAVNDANDQADITRPWRIPEYAALLRFLAAWSFAHSAAAPFVVVLFLQVLKVNAGAMLLLHVVGTTAGMVCFQRAGLWIDRIGEYRVLRVMCLVYTLSLAAWPLAAWAPESTLGKPLLVVACLNYVLAATVLSGATLGSYNLMLRLAPRGRATHHLAASGMAAGLAAMAGPIVAGLAADAAGAYLTGGLEIQVATIYSHISGAAREKLAPESVGAAFVVALCAATASLFLLRRLRSQSDLIFRAGR